MKRLAMAALVGGLALGSTEAGAQDAPKASNEADLKA